MRILLFALGAVYFPFPSIPHFVWPLSWCLLADICNHTWIPECGQQNSTLTKKGANNQTTSEAVSELRLFLDECDMFEFNCDKKKNFEIVDYGECFKKPICPSMRFLRVGDYKYMAGMRQVVYDPTPAALRMPPPVFQIRYTIKRKPTPNLPARMKDGQRRYGKEAERRRERLIYMGLITTTLRTTRTTTTRRTRKTFKAKRRATESITSQQTTTTTSEKTTSERTTQPTLKKTTRVKRETKQNYVLKRMTVMKNGRMMVKVIKAVVTGTTVSTPRTKPEDSDFIVK